MESQNTHTSHGDNRDRERRRHSRRSLDKNSEPPFKSPHRKNKEKPDGDSPMSERARTRTRDPDKDHNSDDERNSDSYYSDDYENGSYVSDQSRTPSSHSPSPGPRREGRTRRISSSPPCKQGLKKMGSRHLSNRAMGQRNWGVRSQSLNKESPPKDLDLVTKRVLSARLLKINELKNELAELQLRLDGLQKENKILRQLQHRQEKALHKFEDTENEISQLISRHTNEARTLRERLRRAQERERAADRQLKETEDELHRCRSTLQKLRRLAQDRHLAEREELARKLAQAEGRLEDNDRRIKDLERNLELSSSSFHRQLVAERKKAHEAQEEVRNLQGELERLGQKLKEKERELETKNIYANRILKPSPKKDGDSASRKKAPNRNATKSVQTDENLLPIEFPTPPPAITDGSRNSKEDDYLSSKEVEDKGLEQRLAEEQQRAERDREEREKEREEKLKKDQELQALEEKARRLREEWEREEEERRWRGDPLQQEQQQAEERERRQWERDPHSLERMAEERRKKEQLLARMREIDQETQSDDLFSNFSDSKPAKHSAEPQSPTPSIFKFTEPVENLPNGMPSQGTKDALKKPDSSGRRGIKVQESSEDLTFGSYVPSFGKATSRSGLTNQTSESAEQKHRDTLNLNFGKDKKTNLMQQLFGSTANTDMSSKMEILSPPAASKMSQGNSVPFPWGKSTPGKKKERHFLFDDMKTTTSNSNGLQVAENKPTVKAINAFEDEIEEVSL
nr:PREDICTED: lebercilin [Lepisosteus oculatus]